MELWDEPNEVRHIHPFQAHKAYLCPGCHQEIPPGMGHKVVVPVHAPDLRRHWHHSCWERRLTRRPTGRRDRGGTGSGTSRVSGGPRTSR